MKPTTGAVSDEIRRHAKKAELADFRLAEVELQQAFIAALVTFERMKLDRAIADDRREGASSDSVRARKPQPLLPDPAVEITKPDQIRIDHATELPWGVAAGRDARTWLCQHLEEQVTTAAILPRSTSV